MNFFKVYKFIHLIFIVCCTLHICISPLAFATSIPKEGTLIRDAEIEDVVKTYLTDLFKAAKLNPKQIELFIIHTNAVNAFAMAGNKIGINTGFLLKTKSASQLMGVLAHETAHIQDNHIIRGIDAIEKSLLQTLIGTIGGLGAVFAGQPDAGMAIILGSQELAKSHFLKFSRTQEGSADQGAARLLDSLGYSSRGLLEFLQMLHQDNFFLEQYVDPYAITHPLTSERIDFFKSHTQNSPHANAELPQNYEENFQKIKAKLTAFLQNPGKTLTTYKSSDTSEIARYSRAIAYLQSSQMKGALLEVNNLITEYPKNPFYWELKGQILFESGKSKDASMAFGESVKLRSDIPLLRVNYAHALLEIEGADKAILDKALKELLRAKTEEPNNPLVYRLLAVCYGKQQNLGMAALSLAEMALAIEDLKMAEEQGKRSEQLLKNDPKNLSRAKDLLQEVKRLKKLNQGNIFNI